MQESWCWIDLSGQVNGLGEYISLASYCNLNSNVLFLGSGVIIAGDYLHAGHNLTFITANHDFNNSESMPYSGYIAKPVQIKDFVWLGHSVKILLGDFIGGAIVGGLELLTQKTKDAPDYAIVGGNSTKIIDYRDINYFSKLISNKKLL